MNITIGLLAVFLSIAAYYLGAAAFTPAVLLTAVSAPLIIYLLLVKYWRLGLLALYFSVFAVLTSPAVGLTLFTSDAVFLGVALVGLALAAAFGFTWLRSSKTS
uniref:hypothetical protein n=1 Tax=Microbulbifer agarilyticus TaxID=260552 RepID=UPI0002558673|nr:hypothetical protein [Microbulbifer agarilyticus]